MTDDEAARRMRAVQWRAIWNATCVLAFVPAVFVCLPLFFVVPGLALHFRERLEDRMNRMQALVLEARRIALWSAANDHIASGRR